MVAIAQLMVLLDATIVNIALPWAQHSLGFPNSDRPWVVTAYALAFGSLLLPGGRIGDMFSRKRVFITGLPAALTGGFLAAGLLLLVAFVPAERQVSHPLLPLQVILDRTRGGAYVSSRPPKLSRSPARPEPVTRENSMPGEFNPDVTRCRTA